MVSFKWCWGKRNSFINCKVPTFWRAKRDKEGPIVGHYLWWHETEFLVVSTCMVTAGTKGEHKQNCEVHSVQTVCEDQRVNSHLICYFYHAAIGFFNLYLEIMKCVLYFSFKLQISYSAIHAAFLRMHWMTPHIVLIGNIFVQCPPTVLNFHVPIMPLTDSDRNCTAMLEIQPSHMYSNLRTVPDWPNIHCMTVVFIW